MLEIEGNASKITPGDWLANSDARLKKNIQSIDAQDILQKMLSLHGVTYEWDDDVTGSQRPQGIHYGFTAQNIRNVFPELVTEDNLGFLQTAYGTYDAMMVESIRALNDKLAIQQIEIAKLSTELTELKLYNSAMEDRLLALENKLHE